VDISPLDFNDLDFNDLDFNDLDFNDFWISPPESDDLNIPPAPNIAVLTWMNYRYQAGTKGQRPLSVDR